MANIIRFETASHWYGSDTKPHHDADLRAARKEKLYPSVTSIDKDVFTNHFLERWKMNELVKAASENPRQPHESVETYANRVYELSLKYASTAAQFGSKLHKALENYLATPSDVSLLPWVDRFGIWYTANVQQSIGAEVTVVDHDIGVAGRFDLKGFGQSGALKIWDWKSQGVKKTDKGVKKPVFYDSWARQLSFYSVADAKNSGLMPSLADCESLVIDSTEPDAPFVKQWTQEEIISAYEDFVLGAYQFFKKRSYWPVGLWKPVPDFPFFKKI